LNGTSLTANDAPPVWVAEVLGVVGSSGLSQLRAKAALISAAERLKMEGLTIAKRFMTSSWMW
jgi:hypothetical protein